MEGKVTGKISICVEGIENEEGYIDIRDFSRFFGIPLQELKNNFSRNEG
jgi:hypothetical protein